jgi:hypothetical protein
MYYQISENHDETHEVTMAKVIRCTMQYENQLWSINAEVRLQDGKRFGVHGFGHSEMDAKRDLLDDWKTHQTLEFLPLPI